MATVASRTVLLAVNLHILLEFRKKLNMIYHEPNSRLISILFPNLFKLSVHLDHSLDTVNQMSRRSLHKVRLEVSSQGTTETRRYVGPIV